MNASAATDSRRTCPFCAEAVSTAAKLCPRCRQWLTWRSLRHPVVGLLVVVLPGMLGCLVLMTLIASRFVGLFNPRPFYAEVPGALEVLESHWNWVETRRGPRLFVTGLLTNHSAFDWKDLEFECRLFSAAGTLVDAEHRPSFVTVAAGDDTAFRVALEPARPPEDYQAVRVRVTTARSARSAFP